MPEEYDQEEIKEWVRVSHSAQHVAIVTVSLVQGNLSTKRSVKATSRIEKGQSRPEVKSALKLARRDARRVLTDLRTALAELDEEEEVA